MEEKRLKVALCIDTYFPMIDGVVMVVDNYAKRLAEFADVTVFCPTIDKNYKDEFNYKVIRSKSLKIPFFDYSLPCPHLDKDFLKHLEQEDFDIVHIHSPFSIGKSGVKYAKKHNVPVVATVHSQFKQDIQRMFRLKPLTPVLLGRLMKIFNACDECWAVNEGMRKLYLEEYGLTAKSKVQRNASDFVPFEDKAAARSFLTESYSIKDGEKIFLFVGRLNFLKNLPFILEALTYLKKQSFPFKMLFVGKGQDEGALIKLAKELGVEENIILCGQIKDRLTLEKVYRGSDLFLFPSLYDANSLVQIEAASQALPTLFIREAKTASSCQEDVNAFMSDNNAERYAQKIVEIFENPLHYEEVSHNAQTQLYVKWDDCIEGLLADYRRVIEEKRNKTV